jgi:LacI family transcriptional regulator
VVGLDDVPFARYLSPALTTVRAPIEAIGREAVRQLARLMSGETAQALTLMRTELVIRESCGCQPSFLTATGGEEPQNESLTPESKSIA